MNDFRFVAVFISIMVGQGDDLASIELILVDKFISCRIAIWTLPVDK
jgi:hypothetical protein